MRRLGLPLALSLALGACAAKTPSVEPLPPTGSPTTISATPSPSPSPAEQVVPKVVLAAYADRGALFVYDPARDVVEEVARGEGIQQPAFLSRTEVSFVQTVGTASFLRVLDLQTRVMREVFKVETGISVYGWSPDRLTVAYVTRDNRSYPHLHFRSLEGAGSTRTVATLARALGRGGTPDDQERIEWSPDGQRVLIVYTPADGDSSTEAGPSATQLQVRRLDGALELSPKMSGDPTMGFWARDGTRVYYRYRNKARSWTVADGRSRGVPNTPRWYDPWPSPAGGAVAYDTGLTGGGVRVRTITLSTGKIATITGKGRARPVWVSKGHLWVQAARACDTCPAGTEVLPEVYRVKIRNGEEKRLALPTLFGLAVWYA